MKEQEDFYNEVELIHQTHNPNSQQQQIPVVSSNPIISDSMKIPILKKEDSQRVLQIGSNNKKDVKLTPQNPVGGKKMKFLAVKKEKSVSP